MDTNGNQIRTTSAGLSRDLTYTVTDTIGRTITISPTDVAYTDSSGTLQHISITTTAGTASTSVALPLGCNYNAPFQYAPYRNPIVNSYNFTASGPNKVISIAFPQSSGGGTKTYTVTLDAANRLIETAYSAGGYTRYDYNDNNLATTIVLDPSNVQCSANLSEVAHKYECSNASGLCPAEPSYNL